MTEIYLEKEREFTFNSNLAVAFFKALLIFLLTRALLLESLPKQRPARREWGQTQSQVAILSSFRGSEMHEVSQRLNP